MAEFVVFSLSLLNDKVPRLLIMPKLIELIVASLSCFFFDSCAVGFSKVLPNFCVLLVIVVLIAVLSLNLFNCSFHRLLLSDR